MSILIILSLLFKKERIKKAYIDSLFTEKEFKEETKIIEEQIELINSKLLENEQTEQLNFTVSDILLKRDMDFINKVKLEKECVVLIIKLKRMVLQNVLIVEQ